ncbi:hypothetical protein [Sphingomonas sp. G-3-2-10]|uniref:hypothetical protein n=1 Tax=Sphingomonas sp. G-3-2-10 TaxID=2728838 RepID=UPI00146C9210|nr:hypothetical protein [Sphingomonas sp. G-3-2-10]NML04207.1 hypothetical protein [Sphingomonas sp. G-3-2-10]
MILLPLALLASVQDVPQPHQPGLEYALLQHEIRVVTYPEECRGARPAASCIKPPKRIKVRNFDCQTRGADAKGEPLLYCRVTYIRAGGSLANVQSNNECVALRSYEVDGVEHGSTYTDWRVALVDTKGKCPGARE